MWRKRGKRRGWQHGKVFLIVRLMAPEAAAPAAPEAAPAEAEAVPQKKKRSIRQRIKKLIGGDK